MCLWTKDESWCLPTTAYANTNQRIISDNILTNRRGSQPNKKHCDYRCSRVKHIIARNADCEGL